MKLKLLPSRIVSFGSFRKAHPVGFVLVPNNPGFRDYGRNPMQAMIPPRPPFPFNGELPEDIPAMAHVVVIRIERDPIIVSLEKVRTSLRE